VVSIDGSHTILHSGLRDFLIVLAGAASVVGICYVGMTLLKGQEWIDSNADLILAHELNWLLIPPGVWFFRYQPNADSGFTSPKVKVVLNNGSLVTEACDWMGLRTSVSVFQVQDDVEILMFPACVVNIHSNKLVQLVPITDGLALGIVDKLQSIKKDFLIKPGQLHE
jgi:hypothetical protein